MFDNRILHSAYWYAEDHLRKILWKDLVDRYGDDAPAVQDAIGAIIEIMTRQRNMVNKDLEDH